MDKLASPEQTPRNQHGNLGFRSVMSPPLTDIDEVILKRVKDGIYEKNAFENLSDSQINRHFDKTEDGKYRIKDHIRNMVRFQPHDLMKGVPVARMFDVVSAEM